MATTNKKEEQILIGNDDMVVELTGEAKEEFIAERQKLQQEALLLEAEYEAKKIQKAAILERIGLTEEELQIVLGA